MTRRILIVSGIRIFPPQSGGHLRTANIAKALARCGYDVSLYSLTGRRSDYQQASEDISQQIEPGLTELVDLGLGRGICQALFRRLRLARIWQYFFLRGRFIPRQLRVEAGNADLILCDFPFFAFAKTLAQDKPVYLISHNLEHQIMAMEGFWHRLFLAPLVRGIEAGASQIYQKILVCSKEESQFFQGQGAKVEQLTILPNGVDGKAYQRSHKWRQEIRSQLGFNDQDIVILFAASSYQPNRLAFEQLQVFCREQREWLEQQAVHFLVVGSVSAQRYRDGVLHVSSFVDDVLPYFSASDAAINPVSTGSGTNVKMYEYLAAGLPIISSSFGLRGLDLKPEEDVWIFEQDGLKDAIARIISSRDQLEILGAQVRERFQSEVIMEQIVKSRLSNDLP